MPNSTSSAAYFCKTTEVNEFLSEFTRLRMKVLDFGEVEDESSDLPGTQLPYRRPKFDHGHQSEDKKDSNQPDSDDNLLNVAYQMSLDSELHLDAFISLFDSYYLMTTQFPELEHRKFELNEVLKNAKITNRKFPKIENRIDIEWSKKNALELKYQRLIKDIHEVFSPKQTRVSEYKPPIISGLNVFFGVGLTFFGAYSISGYLGVKDPLYKTLLGICFSFIALVVDTVIYLTRPSKS